MRPPAGPDATRSLEAAREAPATSRTRREEEAKRTGTGPFGVQRFAGYRGLSELPWYELDAAGALWAEREKESRAMVEAAGATVNEVENKVAFQELMAPVYESFLENNPDLASVIEAIQATGG